MMLRVFFDSCDLRQNASSKHVFNHISFKLSLSRIELWPTCKSYLQVPQEGNCQVSRNIRASQPEYSQFAGQQ